MKTKFNEMQINIDATTRLGAFTKYKHGAIWVFREFPVFLIEQKLVVFDFNVIQKSSDLLCIFFKDKERN